MATAEVARLSRVRGEPAGLAGGAPVAASQVRFGFRWTPQRRYIKGCRPPADQRPSAKCPSAELTSQSSPPLHPRHGLPSPPVSLCPPHGLAFLHSRLSPCYMSHLFHRNHRERCHQARALCLLQEQSQVEWRHGSLWRLQGATQVGQVESLRFALSWWHWNE